MFSPEWGAFAFGFVVGWVTYRTLRRREGGAALSDIASVIGAVGGAGVTALFNRPELFSGYAIGLAVGFILYLIAALLISGRGGTDPFMGGD